MNKVFAALVAALVLALPLSGLAAPDETQKQLIQRAQEAKKKLAAAQAAQGAEREKTMQEHMKMMQDMTAQMRKAKPAAGMKPEQMREWMDEHMKLMQEMMSQMMGELRMMMQGTGGMQGMGKK
jgi:uncharacterized protein YhaN